MKQDLDKRYTELFPELMMENVTAITPYDFHQESFLRVLMYDKLDKQNIIDLIEDKGGSCEFVPTDREDEIIFKLTN